jgi:hypothetical protein
MSDNLAKLVARLQKLAWRDCDCSSCDSLRKVIEGVQSLQQDHDLLRKEKQRLKDALQEINDTPENALRRGCDPFLIETSK